MLCVFNEQSNGGTMLIRRNFFTTG